MSTLAQQALTVYCDDIVRDAMTKCASLRDENAKLEPIADDLISVQVRAAGEVVAEFNLLEKDDENKDNEFWAYTFTDAASLPYEHVNLMTIAISGVASHRVGPLPETPLPKLTILQGADIPTIEIVIFRADYVKVTGIVTHLSGSLDEAQKMIDGGRHFVYFMQMGLVSERNRQPLALHDIFENNPFRGALFTFKKIEILKRVTEPAMLCNKSTCDTTVEAEQIRELVALAESNETHEGLARVSKELKLLLDRRLVLAQSRDLYQRVEARYNSPDGSSIQFKLDTGRLFVDPEGKKEWIIEPLADDNCTIPVSSINDMKIFLANVPWSIPFFPRPVFVRNPPAIMLRYGHAIAAVFLYDESIMELDADNFNGQMQYILDLIFQGRGVRAVEDVQGGSSQVTMKLACLQIDFSQVQGRLDVLGVDYERHA